MTLSDKIIVMGVGVSEETKNKIRKAIAEHLAPTTISITYKAFVERPELGRYISTATFEIPKQLTASDYEICDAVYKATNLQDDIASFCKPDEFQSIQQIWTALVPVLPAQRTHTSVSVGDVVTIDGRSYECSDIGWKAV